MFRIIGFTALTVGGIFVVLSHCRFHTEDGGCRFVRVLDTRVGFGVDVELGTLSGWGLGRGCSILQLMLTIKGGHTDCQAQNVPTTHRPLSLKFTGLERWTEVAPNSLSAFVSESSSLPFSFRKSNISECFVSLAFFEQAKFSFRLSSGKIFRPNSKKGHCCSFQNFSLRNSLLF